MGFPQDDSEYGDADARLVLAMRRGARVHVNEVCRGLDCRCTCPHCGRRLVARQGEVRVPHFAHYRAAPCEWGPETAIHLLAKSIIDANSTMMLPEIPSRFGAPPLRRAGRVEYTNVRVEQRYHGIVPDIVVTIEGRDLVIEVYVTNKVRGEKTRKIQARRVAAIEIDVRHLRHSMNRVQIEAEIIAGVKCKRWIFSERAARERPPPPPARPLPPPAEETPQDRERIEAEYAQAKRDYRAPEKVIWPRRFSDERRAIIAGNAPARCRRCGQLTKRWRILDCETGTCICENC